MGIHNLWLAVSPASEKRTFTQIAVNEGFDQRRHAERCLFIGIDASIWMNQAQLAIRHGTGTRGGENPAVRILVYRLSRLLTLPVIPIFIFDGPNRPSKKRGITVKTNKPHWLSSPFQKFIDAFGFFWYMAPGEAEADLAELNRRNEIDAIISEDSDALVFGACCIIRMKNVKDVGDQVTVFNAETIQTHPKVSLDREALFFMAILCGGDYDKIGLDGCGWKTARQLAHTDLAHSLFTAAVSSPSREALQGFLCEWRKAFRTLLVQDPDNTVGQKFPSLAKMMGSNFPSIDVVLQYAKPLTSWTTDQAPDTSQWRLRQPHLAEIGSLCEKFFSWGSSGNILSYFKGSLWPGVAIRYLLQLSDVDKVAAYYESYTNNNYIKLEDQLTNIHVLRICRARLGPDAATSSDVNGYTIEISVHNILRENISRLDAESQSLALDDNCIKSSLWVPASILQAALPSCVEKFNQGKRTIPPAPEYPAVLPGAKKQPTTGGTVAANPVNEFIEGSSNGAGPKFLGVLDLCTPPPIDKSEKLAEGSCTGTGRFLGFIDLCTPSPSP